MKAPALPAHDGVITWKSLDAVFASGDRLAGFRALSALCRRFGGSRRRLIFSSTAIAASAEPAPGVHLALLLLRPPLIGRGARTLDDANVIVADSAGVIGAGVASLRLRGCLFGSQALPTAPVGLTLAFPLGFAQRESAECFAWRSWR